MEYFLESGYTSLNKVNEELCGDRVELCIKDDYMTYVLADGLGSGVKANILATLTSKILCTMISNNIGIEDSIETILQSLPVCKERGVAYSTFSVVHMDRSGHGYLVEFDNPQAILLRNNKCVDLLRTQLQILDKTVYKTELRLEKNDIIMLMSDGVIHAGVGKTLNFGWQRPEIKSYLERAVKPGMSARCAACILAGACNDLYLDRPGDDTTVAAIRLRERLAATIMVGPPVDKEYDNYYVEKFVANAGKKVVCGGTTSQLVARYLHKDIHTDIDFPDPEVPPVGFIEGVDLVTEGVITLRRLLELSEKYISVSDLTPKNYNKKDGASQLAAILFEEATDVAFLVGQSINAAHQGLPIDITMKLKLVERLTENLKTMGKTVTVNYF